MILCVAVCSLQRKMFILITAPDIYYTFSPKTTQQNIFPQSLDVMMIIVLKLNVFFTIFVKSIVVCKICKAKQSNDVVSSYIIRLQINAKKTIFNFSQKLIFSPSTEIISSSSVSVSSSITDYKNPLQTQGNVGP